MTNPESVFRVSFFERFDGMSFVQESLKGPKTARLDLKTNEYAKDLIRRAAARSGQDMTTFILRSAIERAQSVLEACHRQNQIDKAFGFR